MTQELKPSKIGEFAIAIQSPKICALTNLEPLTNALKYVMMLLGMRANNLPNDHEKAYLIKHIHTNYGGHTPAEIKLAFELAVAGKLPIDISEVKCYENFSCLYFSTIMNAYRVWAKEKYRESEKELLQDTELDKVNINIEYALYLQRKINKLPCKI